MINARNNFREGFIMLKRKLRFAENTREIPALSILYAYIEQPIFENVLTKEAEDLKSRILKPGFMSAADAKYRKGLFESNDAYAERIDKELSDLLDNQNNYYKVHIGNTLQTIIDGIQMSLHHDEYNVIAEDTLQAVIEGEEYKMIVDNPAIFNIKEFTDRVFYMRQRGINKETAERYASFGLKDAVWYAPHPELQKLFLRKHEVTYIPEYADYYVDVYGGFREYRDLC